MDSDHGFHRPQKLAALPDAGLEVTIEAKPSEREGLAKYLDVQAVSLVRARLLLRRWRGNGLQLTGTLEAKVTQTCVVSLEPLETAVACPIDRKFLAEPLLKRDADPHELIIDPDGEDPPDPLPNALDLGDLVAEELALNLDPYPRKPGLHIPNSPEDREGTPQSPFAVLAESRKRT
jgi:uncharacterized protein